MISYKNPNQQKADIMIRALTGETLLINVPTVFVMLYPNKKRNYSIINRTQHKQLTKIFKSYKENPYLQIKKNLLMEDFVIKEDSIEHKTLLNNMPIPGVLKEILDFNQQNFNKTPVTYKLTPIIIDEQYMNGYNCDIIEYNKEEQDKL